MRFIRGGCGCFGLIGALLNIFVRFMSFMGEKVFWNLFLHPSWKALSWYWRLIWPPRLEGCAIALGILFGLCCGLPLGITQVWELGDNVINPPPTPAGIQALITPTAMPEPHYRGFISTKQIDCDRSGIVNVSCGIPVEFCYVWRDDWDPEYGVVFIDTTGEQLRSGMNAVFHVFWTEGTYSLQVVRGDPITPALTVNVGSCGGFTPSTDLCEGQSGWTIVADEETNVSQVIDCH